MLLNVRLGSSINNLPHRGASEDYQRYTLGEYSTIYRQITGYSLKVHTLINHVGNSVVCAQNIISETSYHFKIRMPILCAQQSRIVLPAL